MTPQERYARVAEIIGRYRDDLISEAQAVEEIDAVNVDYLASQRNPHYEFVERGDSLWRMVKSSEGQNQQQIAMCEALAAHCAEYANSLKPKPYDGYKKGDFAMYGDDKVEIDHRYPNGVYNISWYPKEGGLAQSAVTAAALTPIEESTK